MAKIKLSVFDHKKKKLVMAGLFENKIFYKQCKTTHFMAKYNGYGIQDSVIKKLAELGCTNVCCNTVHGGLIYIPFKLYKDSPPKQEGHGVQHFVDIRLGTKTIPSKSTFKFTGEQDEVL